MPVNASTIRFPVDKETMFRDYNAAAIVADGGTAALPVDKGTAYWNTSVMTSQQFAVVVDVEAALFAAHTYKVAVEFDDNGDFGSGNTITELQVTPTAVGTYVIAVPRERIPTNSRFMRVHVDVTGATPSIQFAAWVAPLLGAV